MKRDMNDSPGDPFLSQTAPATLSNPSQNALDHLAFLHSFMCHSRSDDEPMRRLVSCQRKLDHETIPLRAAKLGEGAP